MQMNVQNFFSFNISLFGKQTKSPEKLVKAVKKTLEKLNRQGKEAELANKKIFKYLEEMKDTIFGKNGNPPSKEAILKLGEELCRSDLIFILVKELSSVCFETKKSIALVYNYFLQLPQIVDYVSSKPEILFTLIKGYEDPSISLSCGSMLQESSNFESLTRIILYSENFFNLFKYVETSTFHVSSDALVTLKALLTRHKILCSNFLDKNYDKVFSNYESLLQSENYVVRWQSLRLLSEILQDQKYSQVMDKFTKIPDNLKLVLNLLRRTSRNIQYEAFHVFMAFVANPNKTSDIVDMILKLQNKIVTFLKEFQEDRPDDEFHEEKRNLMKMIEELKPLQ